MVADDGKKRARHKLCTVRTNPDCAKNDNVLPALRPLGNHTQICLPCAMVDLVANVPSVAGVDGKLARKKDDTAWVCRRVLRRCKDITKHDTIAIEHKQYKTVVFKCLRPKLVAPLPFGQQKRFPNVAHNCGAGRKAAGAKDTDAAKLWNLPNDDSRRTLILSYTIR